MRLRKRPELYEAIKNYQDIVFLHGRVEDALVDKKEISLEIGTGRGAFLTKLALLDRKTFYVGIELQTEVIYFAARRVREAALDNVRLIQGNAYNIEEWFTFGQISTLYINFCDPWPKTRHIKRRLVAKNFLEKYQKIIKLGGQLHFKTDNKDLFAFALEEFQVLGLPILHESYDLHKSGINNPAWTEYEEKFYNLGFPVCYAQVSFGR